jgi:uncharacterized membrane protein
MTEPLAASASVVRTDGLADVSRIRPLTGMFVTSWPIVLAVAAGLAATGWVATLLFHRVEGLSAPPYDLAFFQQVIWNVGQSGAWVSSFHEGSFLGLHFSPILFIPALAERLVWPDVRVLTAIHAVAIGALAPAAFLFLRAALRPSRAASALAAGLAIPIPIWGAVQDVIRSDFHPEAVGIVLTLLAGWAGLTGRTRTMWSLAIVAIATREDTSYAVAIVGLLVAARGRGEVRIHGRALTVFAAIWAVIVFGFIMPWLRGGSVSDTAHYYAWLGGGFGVLVAPFTMTDRVVGALTRPEPWFVVGGMAASLLGLPLLRPRWAALVIPPLIALLLSAHWLQATVRLHYSLILMVPLLAASAFGGRRAIAITIRARRRWHARRSQPRSTPAAGRAGGSLLPLLAAVPAIAGAWIQGSLPPFDLGDPAFFDRPASIDRIRVVVEGVPPSALLLTDEGLVAPLAGRAAVGRFAATAGTRDDAYVLADRMAWAPTSRIARRHDSNIAILASSTRPVLFDDGRFVLWGPQQAIGPP